MRISYTCIFPILDNSGNTTHTLTLVHSWIHC